MLAKVTVVLPNALRASLAASPIFVSEGDAVAAEGVDMAELHGASLGRELELPGLGPPGMRFVVTGIWRDYARQFGAIAVEHGGVADRQP